MKYEKIKQMQANEQGRWNMKRKNKIEEEKLTMQMQRNNNKCDVLGL